MPNVRPHQNNTTEFKKQRLRVLRRDGGLCVYCGADATCVDHVIPMVRGGDDSMENLVASCTVCNLRKGSKSVFLGGSPAPLALSEVLSPKTATTVPVGPFIGQMKSDEAS